MARNKLASGEFNREKIRALHLQKMDEHRNALIEYITQRVLSEEIDVALVKKMFSYF
jgi:hypothetical protein